MSQIVHRMIATFFCAGYAPKAPGTVGTIAALPLYFLLRGLSLPRYILVVIILTVLGIFSSQKMEDIWGEDPPQVVIDEVVGLLITFVSRPRGWKTILVGAILFRVFDIFKPPPVGFVDKNVPGGLGIMADDVVAGMISASFLALLKKRIS
jgi:phosphatidylglycerophosphatase A